MKQFALAVAALAMATLGLFAQQPRDPFQDAFVAPELALLHQQELGISEKQREAIQEQMEKFQPLFQNGEESLRQRMAAIDEALTKKEIDDTDAMVKFENFLEGEKEIKKTRLAFMLAIRKILTPDQRAQAQRLKSDPAKSKPEFAARFESKMQKIQEGTQDLAASGVDPSEVGDLMQDFDPLMKQAKFKEAEALLDRALKLIEQKKK